MHGHMNSYLFTPENSSLIFYGCKYMHECCMFKLQLLIDQSSQGLIHKNIFQEVIYKYKQAAEVRHHQNASMIYIKIALIASGRS